MRPCLSVMYGMMGGTVVLCTVCFVAAQDKPPASPGAAPFKVCTSENPPPCATAPKPIFAPNPGYSDKARKKKVRGIVILEATVGTDGHTHDIHVVQPLSDGLNEQAVKTLRDWKFQPGTKDGQPVPVSIKVEMDFQIY
jgi:periplasmic protein TonB